MRCLVCIVTIQLLVLVLNCEGNPLTEQVSSSTPDRSVRRARQTRYGPEFGIGSGSPYVGVRYDHRSDLFNANARAILNSRGVLGMNGGFDFTKNGWRFGLDGGFDTDRAWSSGGRLSYDNDRWGGHVSGNIDSTGNYEVGAGFSYRFKKRSSENDIGRFNVTLQVDPCYFNIYDIDRDGLITFGEFVKIFGPGESAEHLFNALDITTGDGKLEEEEFNVMAAGLIDNCKSSLKGR